MRSPGVATDEMTLLVHILDVRSDGLVVDAVV